MYSDNQDKSHQNNQGKSDNQGKLTGISAFQKVLELTKPVNGSTEIWLKLGHNKFVVGNYTPNGHFSIWETSGTGKERARTRQHRSCWEFISNWAKNNDGGVFFIPTQPQGYPLKEAIALSDDIAAELDEGTAEQQLQKISKFSEISGLKPSYIIHSGSKSYHPHWKATEHLPIAQTVYLRQLICIALNSDPAISNPHQPMRIAGFLRQEKNREQTLEYWSEFRYTYDQFLAGIRRYFAELDIPFPETLSEAKWRIYKRGRRDNNLDLSLLIKNDDELYPKRTSRATSVGMSSPSYSSTPTIATTYTGQIPLHLALSKANQEALRGVGSDRNNTGLALARDLIGCHSWLIGNGYTVEGDPYELFLGYCQSCTPGGGWHSREWSSIWRSASSGNSAPARRDLTKFIHWYRWENDADYQRVAVARCAETAEWQSLNFPPSTVGSPDAVAYQEYLEWEEEQEKIETAIARSEFIDWLLAKAKKLGKHFQKGFGQYCNQKVTVTLPQIIKYDPQIPLPHKSDYQGKQPPLIKFSHGQRQFVINKLRALGWQFVLDRSFMGLGKSHDMGNFTNSNGKTWYLDLNHRNPSTETVERNFNDLPVRHNGLNRDPLRKTPMGHPHLKWAGSGDDSPDVPSLCHNAHLFLKLQNKGYPINSLKDGEDDSTLNPICKSCKFHKWKVDNGNGEIVAICAAQKGDGYGFRYSRQEGLTHNQIRASLDSLPDSERTSRATEETSVGVSSDFDFSQDIAIIDEASRLIRGTKTIQADIIDFSTKMMELEQFPELFSWLKPLRETLIPLLSGQEKIANFYGLNHQQLLDLLPPPPDNLEEIVNEIAKTHPSWQDIYHQAERVKGWGKQWRNSMATANWYLQKEANELTTQEIEKLPSNFLIDLLSIWAGLSRGAIRIDNRRQLIITTEDRRHGDILRSMQQVIMLDATGNKRILAQRLGRDADSIIEIAQESPDLSNLTVVNVEMSGMSSNQWSERCQKRIEALISHLETIHPDIPLLGIKKYATALKLDGWWFNDNRGSNAFKSENAIAAVGKPQINLGVVSDEYLTLYGTLEGFENYYQSLIDAEVTQLIGRPRAHLYHNQKFVIYLVGTGLKIDYLKSLGINIVNRHAFEICPDAGTPKQISQYKIIKAVESIFKEGQTKLTAKLLAEKSGLSLDYIKKLTTGMGGLMAFKKWVLSLYNSHRSSTRFEEDDFLLDDIKIKDWFGLKPILAANVISEELENHGWQDFQLYLNLFSFDIQAEIWGLILPLILPEKAIADMEKILSPPPQGG